MANQEHLDILKQGVEVWNEWREKHPDVEIDLIQADLNGASLSYASLSDAKLTLAHLSGADLSHASLSGVDLRYAILSSTDLSGADLSGADLEEAHLRDANLNAALLIGASLHNANLHEANLWDASLESADLSYAILSSADLDFADLNWATLRSATLEGATLRNATLGSTIFGDVDLSTVEGLEEVRHEAPSTIGIDTIIRSKGKIPKKFLREAGVPDSIIEAIPSFIGSLSPNDYYSCFISYSSKDQAFTELLYADLQSKGVRCWFAPEDMKIGDRIRSRIDESIRMYDRLLLVLSEHSVSSKWVESEVEAAMDKEQEGKPPVLFPVRLDNTVMESTTAWAAHIKRTRNIGDFTRWKNHEDYEKAFDRLLRDLKPEALGRL